MEAWGSAPNCHPEQLYLIQKKVTRMISFSNYNTPSIYILKLLNIVLVNKLLVNKIGFMMYKYANYEFPPAINYLYTGYCEIHHDPTRQKYLFHLNKSNIYFKKFWKHNGMLRSPKLG